MSIYIETPLPVGDSRKSLWRKEFQNQSGMQLLVLISGAYVSLENAESLTGKYKTGAFASEVISDAMGKPYLDRHDNPKVGGRILYYYYGADGSQIFGCSALVEGITKGIGRVAKKEGGGLRQQATVTLQKKKTS